ncbi:MULTISPECIES: MarR family winged helix-turn-helix transcriptional regulator [unclassified Undibacterium]|uniref:MarR family winged helix-turn-helix transcriptional regulator n=1 Tax=unclassified Undibacterium TaxID=2630295 RepID=UPI002AC9CC4C|nr:MULTISPECIES: MarR family transcriptional regulator [unclassified Undibacterium]MEB0139881.1 MarR family transcriptional regulator [Undibacterium sp. CCC2.1]MEB0171850.1 MarR family transcriptional regulator [Undibacterium sp. CCC1.1]MEB0175666.1 MarR family transcriptional regulator [Undibacterium sp. CCC3.4]MEB0217274.1 MarR family transcriptional regulator [Undibacterium sp. 5I2]WPX44140.1 MarR family transcriptional regulator [Undibacterium sp. CCC3.4]
MTKKKDPENQDSGASQERPLLRIPNLEYGLLDHLLGFALRRAQNTLFMDFYRATADYEVSPQRFAALVLIAENKNIRQAQLAQALGLHRSGALRLVAWLSERGWVERHDDEIDARAWGVTLTKAGSAILRELSKAVQEHDRNIQGLLGDRGAQLKLDLELIAQNGLVDSAVRE